MFRLLVLLYIFLFSTISSYGAPYGTLDHKKDSDWGRAVDIATAVSAKQHHGHIDFTNECYEQEGKTFCAMAVWYKTADGAVSFARTIRTGKDGILYARDVCTFNKDQTLRTCVNFDNGYTSLWRESDTGDWERIDEDDNSSKKLWH